MRNKWILALICASAVSFAACGDDSNGSNDVEPGPEDPIAGDDNLCGNGIVDDGEVCDDGNHNDKDGCNSECKWSFDDFVKSKDKNGNDTWTSKKGGVVCTLNSNKKMTCVSMKCGNGVVDPGEDCDSENPVRYGIDDGGERLCDETCHFAHYCGDGILDADEDEECDDGDNNDDNAYNGCTSSCKKGPYCGDGSFDPDHEVCETWGEEDGGCIDCTSIKEGFECDDVLGMCMPATCGNGDLDDDEDCDDGNFIDGDGCSKCKVDEGYKCQHIVEKQQLDENGVFQPIQVNACSECVENAVACMPIQYGDGIIDIDGYEECDDGNTVDNDGCTHGKVDDGYTCTKPGKRCVAKTCGDGIVAYGEECDDGNMNSGDGCSARCELEAGFRCTSVKNGLTTCDTTKGYCGDGIVQTGEACDDGNKENGDGCTNQCQVENNFKCPVNPGGDCVEVKDLCGNGVVDKESDFSIWEECDLGLDSEGQSKNVAGSGCNQCRIETGFHCAVIDSVYQCVKGKCRDGYLDVGEECDDGNKSPNDGCSPSCKRELMFTQYIDEDGVVTYEPKCGDGITLWMIPRRDEAGKAICKTEENKDKEAPYTTEADLKDNYQCVFGFVPAEECDDGNLVGGDGCSKHCEIETGFVCSDFRDMSNASTIDLDITYYDFRSPKQATTTPEPQAWDATNELTGGFMTQSLYDSIKAQDPSCSGRSTFTGTIANGTRLGYPDFGCTFGGAGCGGMVNEHLDADGKPVLVSNWATKMCTIRNTTTPISTHVSCPGTFHNWYRSIPGVNMTIESKLRMTQDSQIHDRYTFFATDWGPITGMGYNTATAVPVSEDQGNFTSQLHTFFQYKGGETLTFRGNDDVWAFINKTLFVDLGGMQGGNWDTNTLSNEPCVLDGEKLDSVCDPRYDIYEKGIYELHFFQAERCWPGSDYQLTLTGFLNTGKSVCQAACGDGIKSVGEECDNGPLNKDDLYNGCTTTCKLGPHCGDGVVDAGFEDCDDGNVINGDGCSDKCKKEVN